jgi:APA family basic amino acid/polyamine antiporter
MPDERCREIAPTLHRGAEQGTLNQPPDLVRDLSGLQAAAVVVGNIVGAAIFLLPSEMMRATGSPGLVSLAWIVGAVIAACGAMSYAELAAMRPYAGGEYVFLRDAYGPMVGFLCAWTSLSVGAASGIAAMSSSLIRLLMAIPSLNWLQNALLGAWLTWGQVVAVAVVFGLTALNYVGVRRAGGAQVIGTAIKIALIVFVGLAGFLVAGGDIHNFAVTLPIEHSRLTGFGLALVASLWAYDGWSGAAQLAGEIRDPQRNVPRVLIGAMLTVAALYLLGSTAVEYVFPASRVSSSQHIGADILEVAFGPIGLLLASVGVAISLLACINSTIMAAARIPYAVARDGYFFRIFGRAHPRFHTPSAVLILQAILSSLLLLFGGSYQDLFSLLIFANFLFYLLNVIGLFVFRFREPDAQRPYRVWGYPVTPGLFVAAAGVMLYFSFVENLRNSLVGMAVILSGLPVYAIFARCRQSSSQQVTTGS